jgi:hypothetical protein
MKSNVSPVVAAIVVVLVVVVVAIVGYRMVGGGGSAKASNPEEAKARAMEQFRRGMANRPGGMASGVGSGGMRSGPMMSGGGR